MTMETSQGPRHREVRSHATLQPGPERKCPPSNFGGFDEEKTVISWEYHEDLYGGFLKWRYPRMFFFFFFQGKPHLEMDHLGVSLFQQNLHIFMYIICTNEHCTVCNGNISYCLSLDMGK